MKKLASLARQALFAVLLLASIATATANSITVSTSENWTSITGGSGSGGNPGSGDTVTVQNGATVTVNTTTAACGSIQLGGSAGNGNGTLTFNAGSILVVHNSGNPPSGTVTIGVSGGGTGSINMSSGGYLSSDLFSTGNPGTWTPAPVANPNHASIQVGAGNLSAATLSFFNGFNDLIIAGGNNTSPFGTKLNGPLVVTGNLEVLFFCYLDDTVGNYPISVGGNWISDSSGNSPGAFSPGTSTLTFNGTGPQSIVVTNNNNGTGGLTFSSITVANTSAALTANNNLSISGTLTVNSGAKFVPASSSVIINSSTTQGTLTGSGTVQVTSTTSPDFKGQYKFNTYTLNNLTVAYTSSSAQTVDALYYGNVTLSGGSAKTMAGGTWVVGTLSIAPTGDGTTVSVGAGLDLDVGALLLGGTTEAIGTWGSSGSPATHQANTFFTATTGELTVPPASITISGTQLQASPAGYVTYATTGNNGQGEAAQYVAASGSTPAYAYLSGGGNGTFPVSVTVNNGADGVNLGTLNSLLAAGAEGIVRFNLYSFANGGPNNNNNVVITPYWVITLNIPTGSTPSGGTVNGSTVSYNVAADGTAAGTSSGIYILGPNPLNMGNSTGYFTSGSGPNNLASWSGLQATEGTWTVASVTVVSGNTASPYVQTSEISSITLPATQWYNTSWTYRQEVTINASDVVGSDQLNFPVLVNLTNSSLAAHALANGHDITFTASDGATVLPYEREAYTSGTGALVAWVQVPDLSHTANTVLYMYYGNASASDQQQKTSVWDSNYKIVYHLGDSGSPVLDSTIDGNNGTGSGGVSYDITGQVDGGTLYYNGGSPSPGAISSSSAPFSSGYNGSITYSLWIKPYNLNGMSVGQGDINNSSDSGNLCYFLDRVSGSSGLFTLVGSYGTGFGLQVRDDGGNNYGGPISGANTIPYDEWTYVVMVRDTANNLFRLYTNGIQAATSGNFSTSLTPGAPKLGEFQGGPNSINYLNGGIDEFRVSGTARSANWIATEYNNQSSPTVFYSESGEGTMTTPTVTVTSSQNPSLTGGAVTFTATLGWEGSVIPTGTVTFYNGATSLGTGTVNASGVANFSTTLSLALPTSPDSITAVYGGDGNFGSSTSSVLSQVVTAPSSITINNPSFEDDFKSDSGFTSDSITDWSGTGSYGAYNPTSTQFSWATDSASPGFGDLAGGSVSPNIAQGRNVAYASGGSSISQTLSATLTANTTYVLTGAIGHGADEGIGSPAYVHLNANGATLQNNTIPDPWSSGGNPGSGIFGSWSLTYTAPGSGANLTHAMQIVLGQTASGQVYYDNLLFYGGIATTTGLAPSANPSTNGQSVTLTATVTVPAGSTAPTTGTVTFMDGTVTLGTATVNGSGVATFTTSSLSVGTHTLTAAYGGSGNYGGSISSSVSQVVNGLLILNPGFELSVNVSGNGGGYPPYYDGGAPTDWSGSPTGTSSSYIYGAWSPLSTVPPNEQLTGYGGNNVGFIEGTTPAILYQDIGSISQSGTYQLSLLVGNDKYSTGPGNPTIVLATGSSFGSLTPITATSSSTPALTAGNFGTMVTWTFNYTIPANTQVWLELENNDGNGVSIDFDNLQIPQVASVGPLDHFAISSISSPQTAGTPFTITTITAQDVNNNTVTTFSGAGNIVTYSGTAGILGTSATFSSGVLSGVSVTPTVAGSSLTFIVTGPAGSGSKTGTATITTINPGALDHFAISAISSPQTAGTAITGITLTAKDVYNNTVTGFSGAGNIVTYSGTAGILGTSATFSSGVLSGVSVTPTVAGSSLTFIVTGPAGSGSKTGTATITTINPGALDHFAISAISSPQMAGTAITGITLTAQDVDNNTVTTFSGAGNIVTYSGTAGILGTSATFSSGVLSGVSVTPTVAGGSQTFIVTGPAGSGSKTGTATFAVNAGTFSQLVMNPTTIASATAGTSVSGSFVSITAEDAYGNVLSSGPNEFTSMVTFGGTAGATGTSAAFTAGVLNTFPPLTPTTAGSGKTVTATSGSIVGTTTITTVNPGTATKFFIGGSSSQTAGTGQNLTITAEDSGGNTVTGFTETDSLTFSGAASSANPVTAPTVNNSSGTAIAFGSATAISFTGGVATVSAGANGVMTLYDAQTATISVTDGSISSSGAGNLVVTVSPATANNIVFVTQPNATNVANIPFTNEPVVAVEDQYGNTNTSGTYSTANVSLSVTTGTGSLGGTTTQAASGGLANFAGDGLYINFAGTNKVLTATATVGSGPVNATTSPALTILPGGPPIANATNYIRAENTDIQISVTNFLAVNTGDAYGDAVELLSVAGGLLTNDSEIAVTTNGTVVFYANPYQGSSYIVLGPTNNLTEMFSYVVADTNFPSYTTTNFITIGLTRAVGNPIVSVTTNGMGGLTIIWAAIPGSTNITQLSSSMNGPWTNIFTNVVPPAGLFTNYDPSPPEPTAFYQLQQN